MERFKIVLKNTRTGDYGKNIVVHILGKTGYTRTSVRVYSSGLLSGIGKLSLMEGDVVVIRSAKTRAVLLIAIVLIDTNRARLESLIIRAKNQKSELSRTLAKIEELRARYGEESYDE
jgi:hypothetical protein